MTQALLFPLLEALQPSFPAGMETQHLYLHHPPPREHSVQVLGSTAQILIRGTAIYSPAVV